MLNAEPERSHISRQEVQAEPRCTPAAQVQQGGWRGHAVFTGVQGREGNSQVSKHIDRQRKVTFSGRPCCRAPSLSSPRNSVPSRGEQWLPLLRRARMLSVVRNKESEVVGFFFL